MGPMDDAVSVGYRLCFSRKHIRVSPPSYFLTFSIIFTSSRLFFITPSRIPSHPPYLSLLSFSLRSNKYDTGIGYKETINQSTVQIPTAVLVSGRFLRGYLTSRATKLESTSRGFAIQHRICIAEVHFFLFLSLRRIFKYSKMLRLG